MFRLSLTYLKLPPKLTRPSSPITKQMSQGLITRILGAIWQETNYH